MYSISFSLRNSTLTLIDGLLGNGCEQNVVKNDNSIEFLDQLRTFSSPDITVSLNFHQLMVAGWREG